MLSFQVEERAIEVHGSAEQIEKEKHKKMQKREKAQQKKFDKNVHGMLFNFLEDNISRICKQGVLAISCFILLVSNHTLVKLVKYLSVITDFPAYCHKGKG